MIKANGSSAAVSDMMAIRQTAAMVFGCGVCIALLLAAARAPNLDMTSAIIGALTYVAAIVAAPALFPYNRTGQAAATLAAALLPLVGYLSPIAAFSFAVSVACIGFARMIRHVEHASSSARPRDRAGIALAGLAILWGWYIFAYHQSADYASAFTSERALLGILHRDAYFHAALTEMFTRYGVISFGADTLRPFNYHFGFHIWFGGFVKSTGVEALQALPAATQILLAPLLLQAALLASRVYSWRLRQSSIPFAAAGLLVFTVIANRCGVDSEWHSQSWSLGLAVTLIGLSVTPALRQRQGEHASGRLSLAIGALVVCAGLAGLTKVSLGLLLLGYTGFICLREFRLGWPTLVLAVAGLALLLLTKIALLSEGHSMGIVWFNYLMDRSITHTLAEILCIGLAWALWRKAKDKHARRFEIEALFLLAAIAIAVPNIVLIDGGSGLYFLDVIRWFTIPLIFGWLIDRHGGGDIAPDRRPIAAVMTLALILTAGMSVFLERRFEKKVLNATRSFANANLSILPTQLPQNLMDEARATPYLLGANVDQAIQYGNGLALRHALVSASKQEGDAAVVAIPEQSSFWSWPESCALSQGFWVPAVARLPVVNVAPTDAPLCAERRQRSAYRAFGFLGQTIEGGVLAQACDRALTAGFNVVLVLPEHRSNDGTFALERRPCGP